MTANLLAAQFNDRCSDRESEREDRRHDVAQPGQREHHCRKRASTAGAQYFNHETGVKHREAEADRERELARHRRQDIAAKDSEMAGEQKRKRAESNKETAGRM